MTARELRQYNRHQIGQADAPQPLLGALAFVLILSFALVVTGWAVMILAVNSWLQPWQ